MTFRRKTVGARKVPERRTPERAVALSILEDKAVLGVADGDVEQYSVVRVADEGS